jgi:sulfite exporter TauE/SafE
MIFGAAFLLGFLGSMHCVGMCGPIVLAIPINNKNKISPYISNILYNFGRVITYSFLGLIFGFIGQSLSIIVLQSHISITFGSLILIYLLIPSKIKSKMKFGGGAVLNIGKIKQKISQNLLKTSYISSIFIGLLNGFLPCGLVYAALAGAVATASLKDAVIYMALFGTGTIPAMAFLYHFKSKISLKIRQKINKFIPFGIALVAILMILRGLNLGIPLVSPKIEQKENQILIDEHCEPSSKFAK